MENKKEEVKVQKKILEVDEDMLTTLRSIDRSLQKINRIHVPRDFGRGLIQGLGFILGTTVLLALTILVLRQFLTVPVIGEWIKDVIEVVERR